MRDQKKKRGGGGEGGWFLKETMAHGPWAPLIN